MITITPLTEVTLTHRAFSIAVAASGQIAAIGKTGAGTLLAPDHTTCANFNIPAKANDVSLSADGSLIAVVAGGRAVLISTADMRVIHRIDDPVEGVVFAPNGGLWCASSWDDNASLVEFREPETWEVTARTEVADPYGGSAIMMFRGPDQEHVAVWLVAGPDGQCLNWVRRSGAKLIAERFPGIDRTTPPGFSPSGKRFLTICSDTELLDYEFPMGPLRATLKWPFDDTGDQVGDQVAFVDEDRALLQSLNYLLYLVDLKEMAIVDEIELRGYEPMAKSSGDGKSRRYSDLQLFVPLPNGGFVSPFPTRLADPRDGCDCIVTWHVP
jgi:hypothetical protein